MLPCWPAPLEAMPGRVHHCGYRQTAQACGDIMTYTENKNLHDSLRAHFQTVDVKHLNTVLSENGLTDLDLRKKILEDYFFAAGQFFDAGWFEADGKKYSAIVCFREVEADLKRSDKMICPDPVWGTIFHEMAIGTAEMVAEDPDDKNVQVRIGEVQG